MGREGSGRSAARFGLRVQGGGSPNLRHLEKGWTICRAGLARFNEKRSSAGSKVRPDRTKVGELRPLHRVPIFVLEVPKTSLLAQLPIKRLGEAQLRRSVESDSGTITLGDFLSTKVRCRGVVAQAVVSPVVRHSNPAGTSLLSGEEMRLGDVPSPSWRSEGRGRLLHLVRSIGAGYAAARRFRYVAMLIKLSAMTPRPTQRCIP